MGYKGNKAMNSVSKTNTQPVDSYWKTEIQTSLRVRVFSNGQACDPLPLVLHIIISSNDCRLEKLNQGGRLQSKKLRREEKCRRRRRKAKRGCNGLWTLMLHVERVRNSRPSMRYVGENISRVRGLAL